MERQKRLSPPKPTIKTTWGKPQYNAIKGKVQRIETSRGCPNNCPYCYEPTELEVYGIPRIKKNVVEILDMNFLYQPHIIERIRALEAIRVNGQVVTYKEVCGFDYRLLTPEIARELKKARFKAIKIAWDYGLKDQKKIKQAIDILREAGYRTGKHSDISVFMLVNWKISYEECVRKLDLLKIWGALVCDCCYNGGYSIAVPEYWTAQQIKNFRAACRFHNKIVNFRIDPEAL